MNLLLQPAVRQLIIEACQRGYPEECCGALLGPGTDAKHRAIVRALPLANERTGERQTRYLIGPDEFRSADAAARSAGLEIVGFYHSHPDQPAIPSAYDREHAWPWYTYLIVPVEAGQAGVPRAWQLADDRSRFAEITIRNDAVVPTLTQEAR